jgi:hypothetical protein
MRTSINLITYVSAIQFALISCSSQNAAPTSNTQINTTPAAIPVKTSTSNTKYVYPPQAISNYIDVCTKGGGTKKSCSCFISKAQNIYPLETLIKINNDSAGGKPYPKDIDGIIKSCDDKVAVVPETKTPVVSTQQNSASSIASQCSQLSPIVFTNPPPSIGDSAFNFYKEQVNKLQQISISDPKLKAIQARLIERYQYAAGMSDPLNKDRAKKMQNYSFNDDLSTLKDFAALCRN